MGRGHLLLAGVAVGNLDARLVAAHHAANRSGGCAAEKHGRNPELRADPRTEDAPLILTP
jgi:hypothetical protein